MVIFLKLAFVHCAELNSVYFLLSYVRLFQEALHYQNITLHYAFIKYSIVL